MKNNVIRVISLLMVFSVIFGLCSCKLTHKKTTNGVMTTNRVPTLPSSSKNTAKKSDNTVKAIAPEGDEEIIKYFNNSLTYFRSNDFEFTRKKSTTLESYSAGTLATVEGATQSYQSALKSAIGDMMGVGSLETMYYIGDDISAAFAIKAIAPEYLKKCSAKAEDSNVKLTFEYKQYITEEESGITKLTGDYVGSGGFSSKIREYGASPSEAKAEISGIKLTAVIDYSTNNFVSLKIEFTSKFSAKSISLDYVSGGPVSGTTKTTISYGSFVEK